jgi:DNA topoisomerase-2
MTTKQSKTKGNAEEEYQKMTHHEHILKLPDTYIGSIKEDMREMWVYDDDKNMIVKRDILYIPGLFKIFDEIIVNARDQTIRSAECRNIKVTINKDEGRITVWNDGSNIPVKIHDEHKIWIPEMIFSHLLTSSNYNKTGKTVGGKNGYGGKCILYSTRIPLWNGTTKIACDVCIGDELIGDDGTVRKVLNVMKGTGQMYKIRQTNADEYVVNDNHTLTLHMPDHKVIFWNSTKNGWTVLWWNNQEKKINCKSFIIEHPKIVCDECKYELHGNIKRHYSRMHKDKEVPKKQRKSPITKPEDTDEIKQKRIEIEEFCKTIPDNNVFDINIQDYMKLDETTKKRLAGVRGECVQWPKQEVTLDPYLLGLWLGDGLHTGYGYTCYGEKDPELIDYIEKWCEQNDAIIKQKGKYVYSITSNSNYGKKYCAPIRSQFRKYNITKDKHIPIEYLLNDRDTRLQVLAGLIDTDGHVSRNGTRASITQGLNHTRLVNDIVFMVRSLGFSCQLTKKNTSWTYKDEKKTGEAWNINISGNGIEDIPTLLPRKKCAPPVAHNTQKTTGFIEITDAGIDDYVGIQIDGNERFVINDFTVTHNCTNVFSKNYEIKLFDAERKKQYSQLFENNMYKINPPIIEDVKPKTKSFFQASFVPDYERFSCKGLSNDMYALFKKRIYDLAVCTKNCKIYFNDELIKIESFLDYVKLYYEKLPSTPIYEEVNDRWSICAIYDSNNEYGQISFVNGISTFKGGAHVNHVLDQITRRIVTYIKEKHKLTIKGYQIKEKITVFINSVIEDPSFSSQTKEELTTKVADFGSKCELSDEFIEKMTKTGLVEEVVKMAEVKEMLDLKKTDGKKTQSVRGIDKYDPALWAGTQKAHICRLILTEGDSAKSFALAGTEVIGREKYGVFPLKGKPLNVREATAKQILNNEEFNNIKKILGLKQNKKYTSTKGLNYGGILILSDQDEDGHHIKGLLINMIHHFWPSLLINVPDFIQTLSTPIVKAFKKSDTKKQNPIIFFTLTEYEQWKEEIGLATKNYDIKYYKGLGTSVDEEAKESFVDFDKKVITYKWEHTDDISNYKSNDKYQIETNDDKTNDDETIDNDNESDDGLDDDYNSKSNDAITLAFQKSRANERKTWLFNYDRNDIITSNVHEIPYSDFINKVMKHFSNSDNVRSIADLADGMKPSQRKILYACFKKNIVKNEIKVAQLAGYVSEIAEYHHGEASLQGAIIKMAQDFVGSNNINLLTPNGNFGSRRLGGADAASARYIFTQLNHLSKLIFRSEDDAIYNYIDEDGTLVEPERYAPIIPMILVNGTMGIGTGFSTDIQPFNPSDILRNLLKMLNGEDPDEMIPWFKGFKGTIKGNDGKIYSIGKYEIIDESNIKITELPVGTWTDKYKEFLESIMMNDKNDKSPSHIVTKYQNLSSNNTIDFTVTFAGNHLQNLIKSNTIEKKLKLISSIPITNMYMYNTDGKITKYETIEDILLDFYKYRLQMYQKRKTHMLKELLNDLEIIKYRILFIQHVLAKKIILDNLNFQNYQQMFIH